MRKPRLIHKERVLNTFNFQKPDAVPIDYAAFQEITESLCSFFELQNKDELLDRFGVDFRWIELKWLGDSFKSEGGYYIDPFGIPRAGIGEFGHVVENPLSDIKTQKDVENYRWPSPDDFDYETLADECIKYEEFAIVSGCWGHLLTIAFDLVGMERFLTMMYDSSNLSHSILEKVCNIFQEIAQRMFSKTKGQIDIYVINDDYGSQQAPLMSLNLWRTFIKPRLKCLYSVAKKNGSLIMQHSCGSIRLFIPDLIEIGADILNPIQVNAFDMDPETLSRDFQYKIGFHGSIDVQYTLPFGSIEDVKKEVIKSINMAKSYPGWAIAPNQTIMPETPLENVIAMYETLNKFRWFDD
ncbi:MAG: hypothetical protein M1371_11970 [Actinobacteria bacterium]|nr:hypothetical protein [Actinomycetota bacterium]